MPRTRHPLAIQGDGETGFERNGHKFRAGDRITVEGKIGYLDEVMPDGDCLISWDDGSFGVEKWCAVRHPI